MVNQGLGKFLEPFVTSMIVGKDMVPRMSMPNLARMIDQMVGPQCSCSALGHHPLCLLIGPHPDCHMDWVLPHLFNELMDVTIRTVMWHM